MGLSKVWGPFGASGGLDRWAQRLSISDGLFLGQPRGHADDPREFEDSVSEYNVIPEESLKCHLEV